MNIVIILVSVIRQVEKRVFFSTSKVKNIAWLTSLISDKVEYYAEQAVSRAKDDRNVARYGPTIYLAGMTEVPQDVFLGKRSLTFQWVHGAAPFSIKIMQLQEVVFKAETDQHHIQTNKINWRLGKYKVSIIDKHGKKESVMFNVIKRLLFAEQLFSFLEVDKNDNLKQYTYLGAMAMVDDGRYALEAYQQQLRSFYSTKVQKMI